MVNLHQYFALKRITYIIYRTMCKVCIYIDIFLADLVFSKGKMFITICHNIKNGLGLFIS